MKKFGRFTLGGIQQKVFNLVLIVLLLAMAAYSVVIIHQMNAITSLSEEASGKQKAAVTEISEGTMEAVVSRSLGTTSRMQAYIADDLFSDTADLVTALGDRTRMLFEAPEGYAPRAVQRPGAVPDGTACVQLLTEEGVDPADPAVAENLGLLGNLSDMMLSLYAHAEVDSCYIATPDGVMILVDDHPSTKFAADGSPLFIPVREREWYTGAVETGGLYFTDIVSDVFTGKYCVMCSVPVYAGGKLVAVAGADLFLDNMEAYVNTAQEEGGFVCIVNDRGHVVFSPRTEGIFRVAGQDAADLRTVGGADLAAFIDDALRENTDVRLIEADGETWYVTGAPVASMGWAVVNLVEKSLVDQPTLMMEAQHDEILSSAGETFREEVSHARTTILVLLAAVAVLALGAALLLAGRIVKPLEKMTKKIVSADGENLLFRMEDNYKTGDEVEALAEAFAALSARTLEYVEQVRSVTAEKERIGTELALATNIQASMLPHIFPAFPERDEFDIYASMDPAKEVGGDFYDYFLIDDDHLCMVIADVSGKGVPAALFMMASKIIIQSTAKMGCSPAEILTRTNAAICSNNEAGMFVTVWLGILELSTGKLTAANAGHEFPAIRRPNRPFELYKDKHGFVLGGLDGVEYQPYELLLEPGSRLFLYTDGVAEATSEDNKLFGTGRMLDALNIQPDAAPEQLLKNVRTAVDGFVREAEQFDDLTMLCVEYIGSDPEKPEKKQ